MKNLTLIFLAVAFRYASYAQDLVAQQTLSNVDVQFFIENNGQWPDEVLYLTRLGGLDVWITKQGVNYTFYKIEEDIRMNSKKEGEPGPEGKFDHDDMENTTLLEHRVIFDLIGSSDNPGSEGMQKQAGYYNYFIGNDDRRHASNVGLYREAVINDVYKGIDVRYYFVNGNLRYDYIVKPGADPGQIQFRLRGQYEDYLKEQDLAFTTRFGEANLGELFTYQDGKAIESWFVKENNNWQIAVGEYDHDQTLIIDPLIYSTYIGGIDQDYGYAISVDGSGNAYVTGYTNSTNYDVTTGAFQTSNGGGRDVFVTKLNATGTVLLYSTYIGGSSNDQGDAISVDGSGSAFVTGATLSTNFDVTTGAFQTSYGGNTDVFVTRLNAAGTALLYSTYIGGSSTDQGYGISVDGSGNAYVTGPTSSTNYDVTASAFQTSKDGSWDAFVTKLNATGMALIYSTYIGGVDQDYGYAISVDGSGNAYVTGFTGSPDYDVTSGAFQSSNGGLQDVFVTKLNATGKALIYSTYIGGSNRDEGMAISVDGSGNAYVAGYTNSTNYDMTTGAFQTVYGGGDYDVFVTRLNATGTALLYSTYIGGSDNDHGNAISVDGSGNAYVAGYTGSTNYDVTTGAFQTSNDGSWEVFVTKLNATGTALLYSTYIGGSGSDFGYAISVDSNGNAYVTGITFSINYDVTFGAFQTGKDSVYHDVFVTKLGFCNVDISVTNASPSLTANATGATYQWLDCNAGMAVISGETNQTFTATANGSYAVEVTQNGCTDTSACVPVLNVEVVESSFDNLFSVYPNPTSGALNIELNNFYSSITIIIRNEMGQELKQMTFSNASKIQLDMPGQNGVYFIEVKTGDKMAILKVIKE